MNDIVFMCGGYRFCADGTEFSSLALVKYTGEELYFEAELIDVADEWIECSGFNLKNDKVLKEGVIEKIKRLQKIESFVEGGESRIVADISAFDWVGICGLFDIWDFCIPDDVVSALCGKGADPGTVRKELKELSVSRKTNALDRARALKKLYREVEVNYQ